MHNIGLNLFVNDNNFNYQLPFIINDLKFLYQNIVQFQISNITSIPTDYSVNKLTDYLPRIYELYDYHDDIDIIVMNQYFPISSLSPVGVTYINTLCTSYSIMAMNIYGLDYNYYSYVIAHEIGHILGANHINDTHNIMNGILQPIDKNYIFDVNTIELFNSTLTKSFCSKNIPKNYDLSKYLISPIQNNSTSSKYIQFYLIIYILFYSVYIVFI